MDAEMAEAQAHSFFIGGEAAEAVLRNADILRLLFGHLDIQDLCRVGAVCKQWMAVSDSDEFWASLDFEGRNIRYDQVLSIVKKHPHTTALNVQGVKPCPRSMLALLSCLTSVRELRMGGGPVNDTELTQVNNHLTTLQQWIICDSDMCRGGLGRPQMEVLLAHDTLPRLELRRCRGSRLVIRCSSLTDLVIHACSFPSMSIQTPSLLSLELRDWQKVPDAGLRAALTRLTTLTSLDVSNSVPLSDETLREVGLACSHITSLQARGCPGLTLNAMRGFPKLRHLNLTACDCVAPATALPALERWTTLETLILDHCGLLTHVTLSLPRLRSISLRHCRSLANVDLQCDWLEKVDMGTQTLPSCEAHGDSNCTWQGPRAPPVFPPAGQAAPRRANRMMAQQPQVLKRVVLASSAMTSLTWRSCPALEKAVLACPYLREAHFDECHLINDDILQTLGDGSDSKDPPGYLHGILRGACPRLRILTLNNCDGLKSAELTSKSIQHLSLANCKGMKSLHCKCPALQELLLEECNDMVTIDLQAIRMTRLSLGTCPHLTSLSLTAPVLTALDLKGCGTLSSLMLDCPNLEVLDATFCGRLGKSALAWAVKSQPPLRCLILSVCSHLDSGALEALGTMHTLRILDLSYTEVKDLQLVFASCPGLETLKLSSCAYLKESALAGLLPPSGSRNAQALPNLKELDVSYCPLSTEVLSSVILRALSLEVLAINGCTGATPEMWEGLHSSSAPQLALRSLSAVGCKRLRSCWLGLQPASPADLAMQQRMLSAGKYAPPEPMDTAWKEVPVSLSGLKSLRLGLSGVRSLALGLPHLTCLDVNNTAELRCLELRCPALLTAFLQACKMLPGPMLERNFQGCSRLEVLDAQHSEMPEGAPERLRKACPALRTILHTQHKPPQTLLLPEAFTDNSPESSGE